MFDVLGTRDLCGGELKGLRIVVRRRRGGSWVGRIAYVVDSSRELPCALLLVGD